MSKSNLIYGGYELHPKEDITVYELARIMSINTLDKDKQKEAINALPRSCFRHLKCFDINIETGERVLDK